MYMEMMSQCFIGALGFPQISVVKTIVSTWHSDTTLGMKVEVTLLCHAL